MNVHPSRKAELIFVTEEYVDILQKSESFVKKLGFSEKIAIQKTEQGIPSNAISVIGNGMKLFIPFEELVDIEAEKQRLQAEKERLEKEVQRGEKMLSNPGFVTKAPEKKIQEEKQKLENYQAMLKEVVERLAAM